VEGRKVVLPVWHEIDAEAVRSVAPSLADKVAARTSEGITAVAAKLLDAITGRDRMVQPSPSSMPGHQDASAPQATPLSLSVSAALAAQRKLDAYDELLRLVHVATGRIVHLYGLRQEPDFEAWSVAQLEHHMTALGFPGKTQAAILEAWERDRRSALRQLHATARQGEIAEAERALNEATSCLLVKAPYISTAVSAKVREALVPLKEILANAKFPDPGGKGHPISRWSDSAATRVEEVGLLMRGELGVS